MSFTDEPGTEVIKLFSLSLTLKPDFVISQLLQPRQMFSGGAGAQKTLK